MFIQILTYLCVSLMVLIALGGMILRIGSHLGDCPAGKSAARTAALTIATGFAAIGTGGIILGTTPLIVLTDGSHAALFGMMGIVSLCLGLGFTHAVATLRAVLQGDKPQPKDPSSAQG